MIAVLLSFFPVLAVGAAITRGTSVESVVLRASLSVATGLAAMSVFAFFLSLVFGLDRTTLWLGELALVTMCWWRVPYRPADQKLELARVPRRPVAAVTLVLAVAVGVAAIGWFAAHRAHPFGDGDATGIWNTRAHFLWLEWGNWPLVFASDSLAHVDYPLLLPMLTARTFVWAGDTTSFGPLALSVAYFLVAVGLPVGALFERRGPNGAAIGGAVILAAPFFVWQGAMQTADLPLAGYLCMGAFAATQIHRDPRNAVRQSYALVLGWALGAALWTKNEGALGALVLVGLFGVQAVRRHRSEWVSMRSAQRIGFTLAPCLLALVYFKLLFAPANDLTAVMSWSVLFERLIDLDRLAHVTGLWLSYVATLTPSGWGIGFGFAALGLGGWLAGRDPRCQLPWFETGLSVILLVGYLLVFAWVSPYDLDWHLRTAGPRLPLHVWPVAVLGVLSAVRLPGLEGGRQMVGGPTAIGVPAIRVPATRVPVAGVPVSGETAAGATPFGASAAKGP